MTKCPDGLTLGLWLDDAIELVLSDAYLRRLEELRFDELAVMVDRSDRRWKSIWTPDDLRELADAVGPLGYKLVLTTWPWPDTGTMPEMLRDMPELLEAARATAWEVDCEGNWRPKRLRGFRSLRDAADFFAPRWLEICREFGIRSEFTTYPGHNENSSRAVIADDADLLLPQGYSVRNRKKGNKNVQIPYSSYLGPGRAQRWTHGRAVKVPGEETIGMGLAAYDQDGWPEIDAEGAMRAAFNASVALPGVRVLRWWSSKWVFGKFRRRNAYAARFLNTLR